MAGIAAALFGRFSPAIVLGSIMWLIAEWWFFKRGSGSANQHVRGSYFMGFEDLKELKKDADASLEIGGIPIPRRIETVHFLASGMVGTGKSQAINGFLDAIRARSNKAMIVDSGAEAFARWYEDGDIILNPFDERTVSWSPLAEMTGPWDAARIALAFIPEAKGSSEEWNVYARQVLEATLAHVFAAGGTNADIINIAALSKPEELQIIVAGKPVAALFHPGSAKMLDNVRSIVGAKLSTMQWLDPDAGVDAFSIRRWVRDEENKSWIWMQYKEEFFEQIKPLIAAWCGLLTDSVLSLDASHERRIFLVVDELGALPKISGFTSAMTRGRKFGLCVVAGIQSIAQLRDTYGRDGAQTLLSNFGSWLILRAGDKETAEYMQDHLGKAQIIRTETSTTKSQSGESTSTSHRHADEALVMYSEIMKFKNLFGVLSLADGIPAAHVNIPLVNRKPKIEAWIPRDFTKAKKMPEMPVFSSQFEDI
jgi:hypothetical protein